MPEIPLGNVVGPQGPQGPKGDKGDKGDTGTFDPADLQRISNLETGKVDKVTGKGLSTNDYTDADKVAVATIGNKVDKVTGKGLSTNDYTDADKTAVATIGNKVDKVTGKGLSTNDYTDADKTAVATIGNKVDKVTGKGLSTNDYTDADKTAVATIGNKVDKVTGKGLSTNDYTDADKNKLAGIPADANHTTIDATLSNTGQAADAKATGDSIAALQSLFRRMEIYCEASGNPATFFDAAAANVKALSVAITPTQSGSGDPYPPGGGKNLLEITASSTTINGVTFTVDAIAGTVTVNGTNSESTSAVLVIAQPQGGQPPGRYRLLSGNSNASTSGAYIFYRINGNGRNLSSSPFDVTISEGDAGFTYFTVQVAGNATVSNMTLRPMLYESSGGVDDTFAPYSNIRPISGVSSVGVMSRGNGKNWWPVGNTMTFTHSTYVRFPAPPPGNYTFSAMVTSSDTDSTTYSAITFNGTTDYLRRGERYSVTFNIQDTRTVEARLYAGMSWGQSNGDTATWADIQLESGNSATAYEPYQGQIVTVPLVDSNNDPLTVYGGMLDITTGTLSVTWANIASYNGETLPGRWISDRDVYASGTAPTTGAQVVYELASPVTYQLTPQQLATLAGYNAVYSDAGNVDVTYKADASLVWGGAT